MTIEKARGYKLHGQAVIQGLHISIENEQGTVRRGVDKDNHEWCSYMYWPYGALTGSEGKDGENVDVYLGPSRHSKEVYVVHQNDPTTGRYDEDKTMLFFNTAREAKKAYLQQYDRPGFFGSMDQYSMEEFKELLKKRQGEKLKKGENMKTAIEELKKALDLGESEDDEHGSDALGGPEQGRSEKRKKRIKKRKKMSPAERKVQADRVGNGVKKDVSGAIKRMRKDVLLTIFRKVAELVQEGKLSLVDSGIIESRINKSQDLDLKHWRALGMEGLAKSSYQEQMQPFAMPVGSAALRIDQAAARTEAQRAEAERAPDRLSSHSAGSYEFYSIDGTFRTVSGQEILRAVSKGVQSGRVDLMQAGLLEKRVNHASKIDDAVLRQLFE